MGGPGSGWKLGKFRKEAPTYVCAGCGQVTARKRIGDGRGYVAYFDKNRYCTRACAKRKGGSIDHGYRRLRIGTTSVLEHRLVMEQTLGRPLLATEEVHHRNGDKLDNRPENLELWTRSQPRGQRVEDKVDWAILFLTEYGFTVSAPYDAANVEQPCGVYEEDK